MPPKQAEQLQHGSSGPATPQLPETSYAERVRTLFSLASSGTLCTLSQKHPGFPFGSLMPYALDLAGRPVLLISNMAMHTQNLKVDFRVSLFVTERSTESTALGAARATLVGNAEAVPAQELEAAREFYLARHQESRYWVDFTDFTFYRLEPIDLYYVGGFGVMGWVQAGEYTHAAPDPLAPVAAGIIAHINADHQDSMILLARRHAEIEASEAQMTSVDRLGFWLRLKTAEGMKGARVNFSSEVRTAQQARVVLVEMVAQARSHADQ